MAHIGSYVPADYMEYTIFDGIFLRFGSKSCLIKNMSSFLYEMTEMSQIFEICTDKSLVIVDEVTIQFFHLLLIMIVSFAAQLRIVRQWLLPQRVLSI